MYEKKSVTFKNCLLVDQIKLKRLMVELLTLDHEEISLGVGMEFNKCHLDRAEKKSAGDPGQGRQETGLERGVGAGWESCRAEGWRC